MVFFNPHKACSQYPYIIEVYFKTKTKLYKWDSPWFVCVEWSLSLCAVQGSGWLVVWAELSLFKEVTQLQAAGLSV